MADAAASLRALVLDIRRKPVPIFNIIPTLDAGATEIEALRARVAKQAALLADLRDAIDSGDRFSYVSGPLRALLDTAIGDAGNKPA